MEKIEEKKINNKILIICMIPIYAMIILFIMFIYGLDNVYAITLNEPDAISINNGNSTSLITCNNSNICELFNSSQSGLHASVIYNYDFKANFTYYFQYNATVVMGYGSTLLNPNFQYYNFRAAMYGPNLGEYLTCTTNVSNYSVSNYDGYWDNNYIGHNVYYDVTFNCSYKPPNDGAMVSFSMLSNNSNPNTFINISNPDMTITTDSTEIIITNQDKNTEKIVGAINGSGLENTTPVNPDKKNELEEIEEEILDDNITTSLENIDISIDTNASEFIWNIITRIINSHTLIFGLVLTMLSLGVLKLVLNR